MRVEQRAMRYAKRHFEARQFKVEDVSRSRGHNGYDLLVRKNGRSKKVEVKGCSREWGIPDLYSTEFDGRRRLVADLLCVVYLIGRRRPVICLIPRKAIPPEYVEPKSGYRINGRFKKQEVLERFVQK